MNNGQTPKISVIIPMFNSSLYIKEAIKSILHQTLQDFEIIVVDDNSTDNSVEIVKKLNSDKITIVSNPKKGVASALNYGISLAKGMFIARMDADDISLPERFAKQIAFLDNNPNIMLAGTYIELFGNEKGVMSEETNPSNIRTLLLFRNTIPHPSVMMRKELFTKLGFSYNENISNAQDFDLWKRISEKHDIANIPEVLLRYRTHASQVSNTDNGNKTRQNALSIIKDGIQRIFNIELSNESAEFLGFSISPIDLELCLVVQSEIQTLLEQIAKNNNYNNDFAQSYLSARILHLNNRISEQTNNLLEQSTKTLEPPKKQSYRIRFKQINTRSKIKQVLSRITTKIKSKY